MSRQRDMARALSPAPTHYLPRPRIRYLDPDLLLPQLNRIPSSQRLKPVSHVVDHIDVAVRTKRIPQAHIRADCLSLRRIRLDEGGQVQKTVEGIAEFHSSQINVEIALR